MNDALAKCPDPKEPSVCAQLEKLQSILVLKHTYLIDFIALAKAPKVVCNLGVNCFPIGAEPPSRIISCACSQNDCVI